MSSQVYQNSHKKPGRDSRRRRVSDWYSVSTASVRSWMSMALLVALATAFFFGYGQWRTHWDEQLAYEWISRAEGLIMQLESRSVGAVGGFRSTLIRSGTLIASAKQSIAEEEFGDAAASAEAGLEELQQLMDRVRLGSSMAWFRSVRGDVRFRRGESGAFIRAFARTELHEGDYVMAGEGGTAEIHFQDEDTVFTLRPDTLMKLSKSQAGKERTLGEMEYGWVALDTAERSSGVRTPLNRVMAKRHSRASVALEKGASQAVVRVREGSATATAVESGDTLDLAERQEVVQSGGTFGAVASLLKPPTLITPPDGTGVNIDSTERVKLTWSPVRGASSYALQITRGRLFSENLVDERRSQPYATLALVGEGRLRWRVAAVDSSGRQGTWSEERRLRVESYRSLAIEPDVDPPAISVEVQMNGNFAILQGQTEAGAALTVNGRAVSTFADGTFSTTFVVSGVGRRPLVFEATDLAGNTTIERREVWIDEQ